MGSKQRGHLITLEGIEGAGKSTHVEAICAVLRKRGLTVLATREPGGTELGEKLRELLLENRTGVPAANTEALMMFAARAAHISEVVSPALDAGVWVVSDRFTDSSYAYQGGARGCERELLDMLKQAVCRDINPDLTLLLDISPAQAITRVQTRGAKDRFESENLEFFTRVRDAYLMLAAEEPARWRIIPAKQEVGQVEAVILRKIETYFLSQTREQR